MYVLLRVVPEHVVAMECKGAVAMPRVPLTSHMSLDSITLRTGICIRLNLFPFLFPITLSTDCPLRIARTVVS